MNSTAPRDITIEPCRDAGRLQTYIDEHWRRGHVLARDDHMLRFTYATPWVSQRDFPAGLSVLCAYNNAGEMLGFLGAICAPYPRPRSFWLALWHVLPALKGTGTGGRLLEYMQRLAVGDNPADPGWIGTFGAGPEALPVYLKRGYAVRAARRWTYDPASHAAHDEPHGVTPRNALEAEPPPAWLDFRFNRHPVYSYVRAGGAVVRTERNTWGRVTHVCHAPAGGEEELHEIYARERGIAHAAGTPYLMDAWSFDQPGPGWTLAPGDLPSVFHPPEARGNLIYAVGRPFVPSAIHKGDCDQDRPNAPALASDRAA